MSAKDFEFEIEGEIEILQSLDSPDLSEHYKSLGADEDIVAEAMNAAQKVFADKKIDVNVIEIAIETPPEEALEKCRCGSRCVARRSEPYTRCTTRNGRRTCVTGHRLVCTRRACNPC